MKAHQIFFVLFALLASPGLAAGSAAGFVIGWGDNGAGEATGIPSLVASNSTFIISGSLFATGTVTIAERVLGDAVAIAAGKSHGLALRSDGIVVG